MGSLHPGTFPRTLVTSPCHDIHLVLALFTGDHVCVSAEWTSPWMNKNMPCELHQEQDKNTNQKCGIIIDTMEGSSRISK